MRTFTLPQNVVLQHACPATPACARYAETELQRLLKRLGCEVRTVALPRLKAGGCMILSAAGGPAAPSATRVSGIRHDGYRITVAPGGIALAAATGKGLLNAVYDLAEQLGFLFLMPGEAGEWAPVPGSARPQLSLGAQRRNPRFPWRGVFGGANTLPYSTEEWLRYHAKLRFNAVAHLPGDEFIPLAQELGMRVETGGHGMAELLPRKLFDEKPELFRMFQPEDFSGKRLSDSNFCGTNPETQRLVKQNYRKQALAANKQGVYAIHAWADDLPAGGWCMCSRCRSLSPTDQAMLAMRLQAEVLREEELPLRVPVIAYHDTMYPGAFVKAPKEGFLLYAPRERCYGHALNDPACARNRWYLQGLAAWTAKFKGIDDAHTFEYYFDQILFRGLYPFIPNVILGDAAAYEKAGIQSHMALQVGGPVIAPEYNMLLFSALHWDAKLTAAGFVRALARRLAPADSTSWQRYLTARAAIFEKAMCLCGYPTDIYFDYRWLPETPLAFGAKIAKAYAQCGAALESAARQLAASGARSEARDRDLARREAARARFEAADLHAMAVTQDAMNHIAHFHESGSRAELKTGLKLLAKAIAALKTAYRQAQAAGLPDKAYYFALNQSWLQKECAEKRRVLEGAQA